MTGFSILRREKKTPSFSIRREKKRKKAEQGDAEAQSLLSWMHYVGFCIKEDKAEAAKWFRKAAEQGLAQAQFNLGWMYEHGRGMPKDEVEAEKWYRKAAVQGYGKQNIGYGAKAQNNLGEIFCKLGKMYENDEAKQKNNREAIACVYAALKWYREAVELGNAKAKNNITRIHYKLGEFENGKGNRSGAFLWYKAAAWGGHADAQFKFGEMYTTGGEIGWGYFKKTKRVAEGKYYKKAAEWYRKAADQGHAEAQFNLGEMYRNGEGVPQDYEEAIKWHRKAAEQGLAQAQFNLGWMYEHGRGMPKDEVEAEKWYRKAAVQGYDVAQNNLGIMYAYGRGVRKNDEEAAKWYRKAADQGHAKAKKELPECCSRISQAYLNGDGVPKK